MTEADGAKLLYLPGFNPVENTFSKLEAILRKATALNIGGLWDTFSTAID